MPVTLLFTLVMEIKIAYLVVHFETRPNEVLNGEPSGVWIRLVSLFSLVSQTR